ncbi:hypothetical protein Pan181_38070 [Aeoliella mucimassa]|uniref:Uncharacterized protein n=1 Tax=Aeoliella mucimassa TaxID=2527972 RepID=A0A518AS95_9BACT|nr:hypothetical protein Pan181_38070 [Aeoliella mucimassa]
MIDYGANYNRSRKYSQYRFSGCRKSWSEFLCGQFKYIALGGTTTEDSR